MLSPGDKEELENLGLIGGSAKKGHYEESEDHYPKLARASIECAKSNAKPDELYVEAVELMSVLLKNDTRFRKFLRTECSINTLSDTEQFTKIISLFARYSIKQE